jgi:hypothetical protein
LQPNKSLLLTPHQLLTQADNKRTPAAQETCHGNTHHTSTPEQWACRCLSLIFSTTLSTHVVLQSIGVCICAICTTTHNPHTLLRPTFPTMMTNHTVLVPSPMHPLPDSSPQTGAHT